MMDAQISLTCKQHPERSDCPDCLISYDPAFLRYGIMIHDGGSSMIAIDYCPWCGCKLPEPEDNNEDYPIHE
ncbi:DUF6980 family protein [Novosphingobium indicum]|jgi:hypothetical protein|uniref:DUF6980 family protein n=1 Tax=Novosphingobium indicum TaxID=462949 RepID=UPI0035717636